MFEHQRLKVYGKAEEVLHICAGLSDAMPRKWIDMAEQLRRAALSVTLNIAEGAGESNRADKVRFYRYARRSSSECAAAISSSVALGLTDKAKSKRALALLQEINAMLTALITSPRTGVPTPPVPASGKGSPSIPSNPSPVG
ncbi:MAG: four helix bundle protein [Longimicrobiales bacterium]